MILRFNIQAFMAEDSEDSGNSQEEPIIDLQPNQPYPITHLLELVVKIYFRVIIYVPYEDDIGFVIYKALSDVEDFIRFENRKKCKITNQTDKGCILIEFDRMDTYYQIYGLTSEEIRIIKAILFQG